MARLHKPLSGSRVTTHLTFHFKDGSLLDETTVFTQRGVFRLVSDHLVQKGPSFKRSSDTTIDAASGTVTVRYTDEKGKEGAMTEQVKLPPDVANGLLPMLLNDIPATVPKTTLSMVATTPKPRLVKLVITPQGEEPFSSGGLAHKATHFVVKIDIGGSRWRGRADRGKTTSGHSHLDARGYRARLHQIRKVRSRMAEQSGASSWPAHRSSRNSGYL